MPKDKKSSSSSSSSKDKTPTIIKSKLTDEERIWVIGLENAIKAHHQKQSNKKGNNDDCFGKLTEFDLAAHAIIAKDQPQKAIHRLVRLQKFKEAYKVRDDSTVYEAIKIVQTFVHAHPRFLQAFGKDAVGRWVLFFQLEGFTTTTEQPNSSSSTIHERFAALYYIMHALQPDLDAIRNGTVWIGDLEGVTRQTMNFGIVGGGRALCRDSYPIKVKDVPCLNAPRRLSAVYAMCRPFLSPRVFQTMVGCSPQVVQKHFPNHLLSKALGGTQGPGDILDLIEENIRKRFENQETFRLRLLG